MSDSLYFYTSRKLDLGISWLLFLLCGWSYGSRGEMVKQIFFYLTLGGFGLWWIYVFCTLNTKVREYNRKIATECGIPTDDLFKLGLV